MNENKFNIGDKVTIIDLNTVAEVASISEDGTQLVVKYADAGGAEQSETVTADKLSPVTASESSEVKTEGEESTDESAKSDSGSEEEKSSGEEASEEHTED